jgi:kojibiose phosphorylase
MLAAGSSSTTELVIDGFNPLIERVVESLMAVSNGFVGTQASLPEGSSASSPASFIAGVFDSATTTDSMPELVVAPDWLTIRILTEGTQLNIEQGACLMHRRRLDLRRATVTREWRHQDPTGRRTRVVTEHYNSLASRGLLLQRLRIQPENYSGSVVVEMFVSAPHSDVYEGVNPMVSFGEDGRSMVLRTQHRSAEVTFGLIGTAHFDAAPAAEIHADHSAIGYRWRWNALLGTTYEFSKVVTVQRSQRSSGPPQRVAIRRLPARSLELLERRHQHAWSKHWTSSGIEVRGEDAHQRVLNFATYHLIGAANPDDEYVSIGARGLTGEAYKGHVFWDTDIFLTPFYVGTNPRAARSLLMYRYHTLPAAREKARRLGYEGALYAWESAADGREVTPEEVIGLQGKPVSIWTGRRAHHISADVAFAVWQYWEWTRDLDFILKAGAEIILETARFWSSRTVIESDGKAHVRCVIGPDEYHESVDDNAYTNGMARWNLRVAGELAAMLAEKCPGSWAEIGSRLHINDEIVERWTNAASKLVDGLQPATGLIEQFQGYHQLEEVDLAAFEPRDVPMDVLLGRERTERSKVIKQADVLMLLYLLRDSFPQSVLEANFRYYEPRTGHGSSLSPGIHAALAARLGDLTLAERYFAQTAAIDLDDHMGNAAGGIHMAAQGTLWQAAVFGYAGIGWRADRLIADPRLPTRWRQMVLPLSWRGRSLQLTFDQERGETEIQLKNGEPLTVEAPSGEQSRLPAHRQVRGSINGRWSLLEAPEC